MTDSNAQMVSLSDALAGKIVVADTSSLLMAGIGLLAVLPKCQLVIPAIVVKELESKRTNPTLGFLAREWLRLLEDLRVEHDQKLSNGVSLKSHPHISVKVEPNHSNQKSLPEHLQDGSNDSTILAVAKNLQTEITDATIVVLSNDIPMRLKATLDLKMEAYEFNASQVIGAKPFDGRYEIELNSIEWGDVPFTDDVNSGVLNTHSELILSRLPEDLSHYALVTITLAGSKNEVNFNLVNGKLSYVERSRRAKGILSRTLEQSVALDYLTRPASETPIVSLGGGAGTGKTLVTIAAGLEGLNAGLYQKVVVYRSLHEMGAGQEMGFLPGNVNEKMEAWAGAVYDALDVLAGAKKSLKKKGTSEFAKEAIKVEAERLRGMIEISPITYLRGRSLANTYMVLEEAQNFSRSEILHILSRAGQGSKIVLTWDADQVDNKYLHAGKNADIWSIVESLKREDLFAHITLKKTERSRVAELASRILAG